MAQQNGSEAERTARLLSGGAHSGMTQWWSAQRDYSVVEHSAGWFSGMAQRDGSVVERTEGWLSDGAHSGMA